MDVFWISNNFQQYGSHLSGFQMVGLPDIRSHSKSELFVNQPFLTNLNLDMSGIQSPTVLNNLKIGCFII